MIDRKRSSTSGRSTFTMTLSAKPTAYHSSYEPEVASTDLVKLDKASQLVPADVIRQIKFIFSGARGHTTAGPPQSLR